MNWKAYIKRFKNPGTVMGIVGYVLTILVLLGVNVDINLITKVALAGCSLLYLLGVMNNPDTAGVDLPKKGVK